MAAIQKTCLLALIIGALTTLPAEANIDIVPLAGPVFSSVEWDNNPPAQSWVTTDDPNDKAYYGLTGLALSPDGMSIYTGWEHAHGARWVFKHDLTINSPTDIVVSEPTHAAHLYSNTTNLQTTPKSLATDANGNVYASVVQAGWKSGSGPVPVQLNDVLRYDANLDAAIPAPGGGNPFTGVFDTPYAVGPPTYDTSSPDVFDIDGDTSGAKPHGIAVSGNSLYVAVKNQGRVVEYDIATGNVLNTFNLPNAQYLRGVAAASDGTVFVADEDGNKLYRIATDGTITEGPALSVAPRGLTIAIDNDGNEAIFGTAGSKLFGVPVADFEMANGYTITGDLGPTDKSFEQIVAIDNVLLWTLEDGFHITPEIVENQILAATIDNIQPVINSVPEPTSMAMLAALSALMFTRRRR